MTIALSRSLTSEPLLSGDVSLSAEDMSAPKARTVIQEPHPHDIPVDHVPATDRDDEYDNEDSEEEEEHASFLGGSTAVKFLLAGGIAGAGEAVTT